MGFLSLASSLTGDPSTPSFLWMPYTAESRKTTVIGKKFFETTDYKSKSRELLTPLTRYYFNGNPSVMVYPGIRYLIRLALTAFGIFAVAVSLVVLLIILFSK